jgi:Holliday junction resolvase
MAATPESRVKKQVVEILKREGVYYFYPVTGGFGRSGVPDIVCCLNGRFFGIECKAGTNKPTALQEAEMARIRLAGGKTLVVNETNLNDVKELVAWIKKQPQES